MNGEQLKDKENKYRIVEDKLVRTDLFCPRCGIGVFMANHSDSWTCGKCGARYPKDSPSIPLKFRISSNT